MLTTLMTAAIRFYQRGPGALKPPCCRYHPTCSEYTRLAIESHGALKGVWLGVRRIGRCHPWGGFGYDPVPDLPGASGGGSRPRADGPRRPHRK